MTMPISIPELLTHSKRIYLSNSNNQYSQALSSHLLSFGIPSFPLPDHIPTSSTPSAFVHFAGLTSSNLETTLDFTTKLHHLLELAKQFHCPLLLVFVSRSAPLEHTAKLLCQHFVAANPSTEALVVEIKPGTPTDQVAPLLAKAFLPTLTTLNHSPSPSNHKLFSKLRWLWTSLAILLTIWSLFVVQLAGLYFSLSCAHSAIYSAQWTRAEICAQTSALFSKILPFQSYLALGSRPLLTSLGYPSNHIFTFTNNYSDTLLWAGKTGRLAYPYYQHLLSESSLVQPGDSSNLQYALTRLSQSLTITHQHLSAPGVTGLLADLEPRFNQARMFSSKIQSLIPDLPRLLAYTEDRTYIVLIQDPTTPRPLGGLVSKLLTISLSHGKLKDIQIRDSATIDAAISGQVAPPVSFVSATNQSNWSMADTLWDPDFSQAKEDVVWFLTKSLNLQPDGIFATTTPFAAQVSTLLSSVSHPSQLTASQNLQLLSMLATGLERRQLFFQGSTDMSSLAKAGWDGGVRPLACRALSCLSDVVSITESSLTSTGPQLIYSRDTQLGVNVNSSQISSTLHLTYTSSGISQAASVPYLVRITLPTKSRVSKVQLNGHQLTSDVYSLTTNSSGELFNMPLQMYGSTSTKLVVVFDREFTSQVIRYQLTVLNQPGRLYDPLHFTLSYPTTWSAQAASKPKFAVAGQLEYNTVLSKPLSLTFDLKPSP